MRIAPAVANVSIVLIGQFNPAIFSPAWFARYDIIPAAETDNASTIINHQEITQFSVERADIFVDSNRFMISSSRAPWITLHDVVLKTFGEFLVHTPIRQMGINKYVHFDAGSAAARNEVGEALAPPAPWNGLAESLGGSQANDLGMLSLRRLIATDLPDRPRGNINVRVEPSAELRMAGIFVEVNDHFELDKSDALGAADIMGLLQRNFESSIERSDEVIDSVMALVRR